MAKQVITLLTDDLDGGEADRTVEFGLDGVNYTIDLSEKNTGKLRKAVDPFLSAATRGGRNAGASPPRCPYGPPPRGPLGGRPPAPAHRPRDHRPREPRPESGDPRVGEQERLR